MKNNFIRSLNSYKFFFVIENVTEKIAIFAGLKK